MTNLMKVKHYNLAILVLWGLCAANKCCEAAAPIDREALFSRHNVVLKQVDTTAPLSVGNGRFCFTADITGMQSFADDYKFFGGIWSSSSDPSASAKMKSGDNPIAANPSLDTSALVTMSEWGWHSLPNTNNYKLSDTFADVDTDGRKVPYSIKVDIAAAINKDGGAASYFRSNPHQVNLVRTGFIFEKADGTQAVIEDIKDANQKLDIWNGVLESRFTVDGQEVAVKTMCLPDSDTIVVDVKSEMLDLGRIKVFLRFPYALGVWGGDPGQWRSEYDPSHKSDLVINNPTSAKIDRVMDDLGYECILKYSSGASLTQMQSHYFVIAPDVDKIQSGQFKFAFTLGRKYSAQAAVNLDAAQKQCSKYWNDYWNKGGVIDLSLSEDPRWRELERRIVLSQYVTAIQQAQNIPAGVSGLSGVSWYGIHSECSGFDYWAFYYWNRPEILETVMQPWFGAITFAKETAIRQGYQGVRWQKMMGGDFVEDPSWIATLLIWHQPHIIYGCEGIYKHNPTREVLEKYKELVFETADFMASFARWNESKKCFELGPPLISAREYEPKKFHETKNPTFELAYWQWGLNTANQWHKRLGMGDNDKWKNVAENLAPLPVVDGIYVEQEMPLVADGGHPMMLGAYGILPKQDCVDEDIMRKTLDHVLNDWSYMFFWDYPMIAMTATRLMDSNRAVEIMLTQNDYHFIKQNGHYSLLPTPCGNSIFLKAAALMAAGWEDCPVDSPGFPKDGKWNVRWENLVKHEN